MKYPIFKHLKFCLLALLLMAVPIINNAQIQTLSTLKFTAEQKNAKIVFFSFLNGNEHQFYGLGQNGSQLRYHVDGAGASHGFYRGIDPTSSLELMRINGNGNVGIGTSNPNAKIELTSDTEVLRFSRAAELADFISFTNRHIGSNGLAVDITSNWFNGSGRTKLNNMTLYPNGNVGIGNTTPTTKLDVNGQIKISGGAPGLGKILTSDANGLASWQPNTSSQWSNNGSNISFSAGTVGIGTAPVIDTQLKVKGSFNVSSTDDANSSTVFHVSTGKQLVFVGNTAYSKYLDAVATPGDGEIETNDYAMWVSKGIVSENYAIDMVADWSDYVLEKEYALPSLKEVETFIAENKHLPNFPSEAELREHGYNLHTMNNRFMKTIEEMTLHSIAQEKKIMEQEKKAQEQEAKMNEQAIQLNTLATELAEIKVMLKAKK